MTAKPGGPALVSAAALAGLAHEVEALRRAVDPLRGLGARVDEVADLVTLLADQVAALACRSAPPTAPSWMTLPSEVAMVRHPLGELVAWMGAVYLRYPDAAASLPECWLWHPDVVEDLLWLMHAWVAAYQSDPSVHAAGDWHDRQRPGVVRRIKAAHGTCSLHAHPPKDSRVSARPVVPLADAATEAIAAWWAEHRDHAPPAPTERMHAAADTDHRPGHRAGTPPVRRTRRGLDRRTGRFR